ncbi:MAG: adenylate cyclase [Kiritimatiellia bacterium]|jgi:adenylate cyclase
MHPRGFNMIASEQASQNPAATKEPTEVTFQLRRPLFAKYFLALFLAVIVPMLLYGASEAWFSYLEQRAFLSQRLQVEARSASSRIEDFLNGIKQQMGWTVQLPWTETNLDNRRLDALRLLRQVPAIVEVALIDGDGKERLTVSRLGRDVLESGIDRSTDPAVLGVRESGTWYGPVRLNRGSEPYMTIAIAGNRRAAGVAVAQINLKLVWDVITAIRVGESGRAFVSEQTGKLVAHPNLSLVLRGSDDKITNWLTALQQTTVNEPNAVFTTRDLDQRTVIVAMARVPGAKWNVFAVQPLAEAFAPIRNALWRTAGFVLGGTVFALVLAWLLARRLIEPIRQVERGVASIGAGQFNYRIELATGDELERLANRVNVMANELALSQNRAERINRLKHFLSPQVADLVENAGHADLLAGRRAEIVVVFGDLRGFTAFASKTDAAGIMKVLDEYYSALGKIIERFDATLTQFSGDGIMVLVNAPVACMDNPAVRASRMAIDMQAAIQLLIANWHLQGHTLGFGVGLAKGEATVGQIGYEGRNDYTAIGSVVNLAARLCSAATDGQVLLDANTATEVAEDFKLMALGDRELKGFEDATQIYTLATASLD